MPSLLRARLPQRAVIADIGTPEKPRRYGSRHVATALPDDRRHRPARPGAARLLPELLQHAAAGRPRAMGRSLLRHCALPLHWHTPHRSALPSHRHAGHPSARAAIGRRPSVARLPVLSTLHLGDQPSPARQAAMVGKPPALSLSWLRGPSRVAHTRASVAAGRHDRGPRMTTLWDAMTVCCLSSLG
jgi:hypothetical protein